MSTRTQPIRKERRRSAEPLEAIQRAAEAVGEARLPELRAQIDATAAFMAEFIPAVQAEQQATGTRLTQKLLALRERLVYSDFGPAEERALRSVLDDLHELVELHAFKGGGRARGGTGMIPTARIPGGAQRLLPPPADASMTSLGSYYLRWTLYRCQDSPAAGGVVQPARG